MVKRLQVYKYALSWKQLQHKVKDRERGDDSIPMASRRNIGVCHAIPKSSGESSRDIVV